MVGKKSGKALLREEGLERTDNNMELSAWPVINMINQKNYYTEYLKRDEQILPLRLLLEERRNQMITQAKDQDRARARGGDGDLDMTMDIDEEGGEDVSGGQGTSGAKVIVIHPGSQNLRIGFGSDAIPKTVPMVIARKAKQNESEENGGEPSPKRIKLDDGSYPEPEKMFPPEFAAQYNQMCVDLKLHMRANKRRVLPNSKELVVNYNTRVQPEMISQHNDPSQVEWTQIPENPKDAPLYYTGQEALRIPDDSTPRYKLFWPLQRGWYNEAAYDNKNALYEDISIIIEEAIKSQLNLTKKDWASYSCVFVIPDLYERNYVIQILESLLLNIGIGKVCFIQESLAATFGAGFTSACVVDIGAQKTSICCVEEGMCIENSRVNVKIGGADVTETFMRMMLYDHFPYGDINLKRRYDFVLAEELKIKYCTMNETDVSVQIYDFHLRAPGQDTRKYQFKTYDEVLLAVQGLCQTTIFNHSHKLRGRRKLIGGSRDLYDDSPNDPVSNAQSDIIELIAPQAKSEVTTNGTNGIHAASTPIREIKNKSFSRLDDDMPSSAMGSPAPEGDGTPAPAADQDMNGDNTANAHVPLAPCLRDDVLPVTGIDNAILSSVVHGARNDERKTRDFLGGIMLIGGGSQTPGLLTYLEDRLKLLRPGYAKDIMIGSPPRELDPQAVVWKGGSVFGKLKSTGDLWIGKFEYDRLGSRTLAYKCLWAW